MFDYTEKKIVTIDAYKKEIMNKFARIRKLTLSSSPWVEKNKTDKIWLCESIGKLKGIGKQGEFKMNKINVHTIPDFPIPLILPTDSQSHILSALIFLTHGDEDKVRFLILANSFMIYFL